MDVVWFDDERRQILDQYLHTDGGELVPALEATVRLIDGFESPYGRMALT